MKSIHPFAVIPCPEQKGREEKTFCVGLELGIGDRRIPCPLTDPCGSYEKLSAEVEGLKAALDRILAEARERLWPPAGLDGMLFTEDMTPEAAWSILSKIQDEGAFAGTFNRMGEALRKKLAEYILTKCNIFSGKGAIFSARYNNVTGLLE